MTAIIARSFCPLQWQESYDKLHLTPQITLAILFSLSDDTPEVFSSTGLVFSSSTPAILDYIVLSSEGVRGERAVLPDL
jgi:hypothetical protein